MSTPVVWDVFWLSSLSIYIANYYMYWERAELWIVEQKQQTKSCSEEKAGVYSSSMARLMLQGTWILTSVQGFEIYYMMTDETRH